jgi:hypothetical protein
MQEIGASGLLAMIEAEQARLREALQGRDAALLAERPKNGRWSVLENVRHLLFAEQAHLGGFAPVREAWSPLGFTPETMQIQRKLPPVGDEAEPDVPDVLSAWETIHSTIRPHLGRDTDRAQRALRKNLRHLQNHVQVIERLLRAADREKARQGSTSPR